MSCTGQKDQRHARGTGIAFGLYGLAIAGATIGVNKGWLHGPALYAAAILPGLAICGQLWFVLDFMRRADEFVRALMAKRFIIAASLTFAVWTVWGFLETYADVMHLPGWLAYATMWMFFAAVTPFIKTTQ